MTKKLLQALLLVSIIVSCLACAAKRPTLSPNEHLDTVGAAAARQDIDDCLSQVTEGRQASGQAGKVAGSTAIGAATGAAVGAAAGAVYGSAGRGAASGAAGGAAAGLIRGLFYSGERDLDPEQRRRVEQCLREKGYEVKGWE